MSAEVMLLLTAGHRTGPNSGKQNGILQGMKVATLNVRHIFNKMQN
jgi:hypothetical protein